MDFKKKIGLWIHNTETAIGHLHEIQGYGFDYILLKISDGVAGFHHDPAIQIAKDAHDINLPIVAWSYIYKDEKPQDQVKAIKFNLPPGCFDIVLDAEGDWEDGNPQRAHEFMLVLEAQLPRVHAHLSSFYMPNYHPSFPWNEFLSACHTFMPQAYQEGHTTVETVKDRLIEMASKYAAKTIDKLIIPTVNTPEMLETLAGNEQLSHGFNVWLWDGSGVLNSQISDPGNDEGVKNLHGLWVSTIRKVKETWAK